MSRPLYVKERIEEWRSRISFMRSTLLQLEYAFKAVCFNSLENKHSPPFLYPDQTFRILTNALTNCSNQIDAINQRTEFSVLIAMMSNLFRNTRIIFDEIIRLQNLFVQRTSVMGTMNLFEFTPIE